VNIYNFFEYFLAFILYSFVGWCAEVVLGFIVHKKFINRGFLLGPYCPIYGCGMMLIVLLLKDYTDNFLVLFILSMVICLVLEYITSYLMELIFKARWWDYSDKKFNINGRVCLEYALLFGIGGTVVMYIVHPFVMNIVSKFSGLILLIVGSILLVGFIIDNIISFDAISKINKFEFKEYKDNTEDITNMIKDYLGNYSYMTKRLTKAFPNVRMRIEKYKKLLKKWNK